MLSEIQRGILITHYCNNADKAKTPDPSVGHCKILILSDDIKQTVEEWLGVEFHELRIQEYEPDDYLINHVDTIYPGCVALSCRLDSYGESRLMIDGDRVDEPAGQVVCIPHKTFHAVTVGKNRRITLVGWQKK